MSDIKTLLAERGKTHGDFSQLAEVTQDLKEIVKPFRGKLNTAQKEALDTILTKIGRICTGDPNVKDHWDDIAGYATLVAERL